MILILFEVVTILYKMFKCLFFSMCHFQLLVSFWILQNCREQFVQTKYSASTTVHRIIIKRNRLSCSWIRNKQNSLDNSLVQFSFCFFQQMLGQLKVWLITVVGTHFTGPAIPPPPLHGTLWTRVALELLIETPWSLCPGTTTPEPLFWMNVKSMNFVYQICHDAMFQSFYWARNPKSLKHMQHELLPY